MHLSFRDLNSWKSSVFVMIRNFEWKFQMDLWRHSISFDELVSPFDFFFRNLGFTRLYVIRPLEWNGIWIEVNLFLEMLDEFFFRKKFIKNIVNFRETIFQNKHNFSQ